MNKADLKIIEDDKIVHKLEFKGNEIIKYVYRKDNGIFDRPIEPLKLNSQKLYKCVFDLHRDKTSSYVAVCNSNNEVILRGNYLWANTSEKTYEDYIEVLKNIYNLKQIKENFQC